LLRKITQTLSAGLEFLSASPHGTAANGQVAWYAGIAAGGTQTFRVVARVTRPAVQLLRLAAVACAAADGSSRPIVCAAHLDRLPAAAAAPASRGAGPSRLVLLAYAVAVLVVLAAGVLAVITFRRLRLRRRPALRRGLTPGDRPYAVDSPHGIRPLDYRLYICLYSA
jgi:hypothetical protein